MQDVFSDLMRDRDLMKKASEELKERGIAKAQAEAEYQRVKAARALEMKAEGIPATLIQMTIKGDTKVNEKLFERECAVALYESAHEALQLYKLDARLLEAQIQREYDQSKYTV